MSRRCVHIRVIIVCIYVSHVRVYMCRMSVCVHICVCIYVSSVCVYMCRRCVCMRVVGVCIYVSSVCVYMYDMCVYVCVACTCIYRSYVRTCAGPRSCGYGRIWMYMLLCTRVGLLTHLNTSICIYIYLSIYPCVCICVSMCVYASMCMCRYSLIWMRADSAYVGVYICRVDCSSKYICMHSYISVYLHMCVNICVYVCICVCVFLGVLAHLDVGVPAWLLWLCKCVGLMTHLNTSVCVYIYLSIYECVCVYAFMYMCRYWLI